LIDGKLPDMKKNLFYIRKVILILLVCYISSSIIAQKINLDTLDFDQLNLYKNKAFKMRKTGIILTFSGFGIMTASYIVGNKIAGVPSDDEYDLNKNELKGLAVGLLAGIAGLATTLVGGYLTSVGGSRISKAELTLKKFDIIPENSMALGVGITLRF